MQLHKDLADRTVNDRFMLAIDNGHENLIHNPDWFPLIYPP